MLLSLIVEEKFEVFLVQCQGGCEDMFHFNLRIGKKASP